MINAQFNDHAYHFCSGKHIVFFLAELDTTSPPPKKEKNLECFVCLQS